MNLHNYSGSVSDLELTFTVVSEAFGKTKEVELIPNGRQIMVTDQNIFQ